MIDPQKRSAIYCLHTQGMPARKIARELKVDRNTVRCIIAQKGEFPDTKRSDKIVVDTQQIVRLHQECNGYVKRIHEEMQEQCGQKIGYSTLTAKIRELEIGKLIQKRCDQVPDQPGAEMQHDTSEYQILLADKTIKMIASLIYLRYSKIRYLKFYRYFNRFTMKCFFHEALTYWGYSAPVCIIDNTNLARLRGSGKNAVIAPEMEQFSKQYGFEFVCHEIGHANRKAGNERSFYTTETNFIPGRKFADLSDLNRQARQWATERIIHRPVGKSGLVPSGAFEYEKGFLKQLPAYIAPPYLYLQRDVDEYGYISFDGNYYWVPGLKRFEAKVLQYADYIHIFHQRQLLIKYEIAPWNVKNQKFFPKDRPQQPRYQPKDRRNPTTDEEKILRAFSQKLDAYLDFALKEKTGIRKHRLIRQLYSLYQKISHPLFEKAIDRALTYRVDDPEIIHRIAVLEIKQSNYHMPWVDIDEQFINRPSFIEGQFTDEVDLSVYNKIGEDENGSGTDTDA